MYTPREYTKPNFKRRLHSLHDHRFFLPYTSLTTEYIYSKRFADLINNQSFVTAAARQLYIKMSYDRIRNIIRVAVIS